MSASLQALVAVRAAKNRDRWGRFAATCYAMKHGALRHYAAAIDFEARRKS